ncbi:sortase-like protein [Amycolatopsis mediterranei S699]|uniref:Sortase-like protein n=2 Tax=Amycolatopsis mediterranei TaxID=33910 RepID=A0A0H3DHE7_AMYMU|nr:class E sortase [Amycolatopsis mediterranei]ADJ49074.1 sortase-like protein [Amycolatopsis mediterranei U32]AEK46034.1 sortase-like protein [Amycolatopsis mediterranei S699]AFO80782.1 sortase-like protein [Amycolatopsis mediterranei S699]AGT87910.1 sortase-like protein [Amycolatopsis mediterranei RB]KDO04054.1 sortase [Amycolatopsis mediterranei]
MSTRTFVRVTPGWLGAVAFAWLVTTAVALSLVVYALGPMLQSGDQRAALADIRGQLDRALGASQSLFGAAPPAEPAEFGSPVAVLEIPRLQAQQVVLEGVSSAETASGPGHVPGTSGLGQPGNAGIVGRKSGYGGPFGALGTLRHGDEIVVATTQGRSAYRVTSVAVRPLDEGQDYGKTEDDRLTLVTSTSWWPLAASEAVVVTAGLEGKPFRPTPQNGRADAQDGRTGDGGAWASLVLAFGGFLAAAAGSTYLYRRWRPVSTYVITAPVLLALAAMSALALWRLFPAWA